MALDIIGWIKGWRLDKFIKKLFTGEFDADLQRYGAYAVKLLDYMRKALLSPEAKVVTDFIPGDWDLELQDLLVKIIPEVIDAEIKLSPCFVGTGSTFADKFACMAEVVKKKDEIGRAKAWSGIAVRIAAELFKAYVGGKFDINKLLLMIPALYIEIFGSKKS